MTPMQSDSRPVPQELKFPENVREVRMRGDALLLSPVRPDWSSFRSMLTLCASQ